MRKKKDWLHRPAFRVLTAAALMLCLALPALGRQRAVLVGIDQYQPLGASSTATLGTPGIPAATRNWSNLAGSVNDAVAMRDVLVRRFGFPADGIRLLLDAEATRAGILNALKEHLLEPTKPGDDVVFFFAGHGSQVVNSRSDEADQLDESFVPADSARGARDIRDKELRSLFNAMIDRGARITVILDSCHSGSGLRGLPGLGRRRALEIDPRDVADPASSPPPEDRGALVFSAARDDEPAWEAIGPEDKAYGAFTLSLLHVLRTSEVTDSAESLFLRTSARLRSTGADQHPVMAGKAERMRSPLFAGFEGRRSRRAVFAIGQIDEDLSVHLQGGWINGLAIGSRLRHIGSGRHLEVASLQGLAASRARLLDSASQRIEPGDLVELESWVMPPSWNLRVWIPQWDVGGQELVLAAREAGAQVAAAGVRWIDDPVALSPSHVVSVKDGRWQLRNRSGEVQALGAHIQAKAIAQELRGSGEASLFLQLPLPHDLARQLEFGPGSSNDSVAVVSAPADADYYLVGRWAGGHVEYAWIRPNASQGDRVALPARSDWFPLGNEDLRGELERAAVRLGALKAWLTLESPDPGHFPYRLGLQRAGDASPPLREGVLREGEIFGLTLQKRPEADSNDFEARYVYVLLLDSFGSTSLLFPAEGRGSVENRFPPDSGWDLPNRVVLDRPALFRVGPPFGIDTYVLIATAEPLPQPSVLNQPGVRQRALCRDRDSLQCLIQQHGARSRSDAVSTPMNWSVERLTFESTSSEASQEDK